MYIYIDDPDLGFKPEAENITISLGMSCIKTSYFPEQFKNFNLKTHLKQPKKKERLRKWENYWSLIRVSHWQPSLNEKVYTSGIIFINKSIFEDRCLEINCQFKNACSIVCVCEFLNSDTVGNIYECISCKWLWLLGLLVAKLRLCLI